MYKFCGNRGNTVCIIDLGGWTPLGDPRIKTGRYLTILVKISRLFTYIMSISLEAGRIGFLQWTQTHACKVFQSTNERLLFAKHLNCKTEAMAIALLPSKNSSPINYLSVEY